MNDLNWLARIEIAEHARDRARERLGGLDDGEIRGEIRASIVVGRVADVLPNWARLNGYRPIAPNAFDRYVWDPAGHHVWVITRRSGYLCVKTLILHRQIVIREAERRHLLARYT